MIPRDTHSKTERFLAGNDLGKSIFPTFDVNVPMPRDTAVPGSYNKPEQQHSSTVTSKPQKTVK